jgi:putative ABC transport system permease protein
VIVPVQSILEPPIIELSWLELALAAALLLVAIALARWQRTGLHRGFLLGGVRTVLQLVMVGYVLVYIFALDRWYLVVSALLVMLAIAAKTAADRQPSDRARLFKITGFALFIGSGITLLYVGAVVVRVEPWYNPRYLIPLFGMIVGNAMNAAALAAERLAGEMDARRAEIEAYLALGASSTTASQDALRAALRAAFIPTINSLMVVGIVSIPGMMTGQILSGTSPTTAVRYQIVVMFMLAGATTVTAVMVGLWYRSTFFTAAEQLRPATGSAPRGPLTG